MIKPAVKLRGIFWKRLILDPEKPVELVWKYVKEGPVDQQEIEDKFAEKAPVAATMTEAVVKKAGPTMKTFFDSKEGHRIFLNLSKLPKDHALVKKACMICDTTLLTLDQVNILSSVWPQETNMEDFERENAEITADEAWEKPEAYMLPLIDMPSLPFRLKVWSFSTQWSDERVLAEVYCRNILQAYAEIKNNPCFMQILG